MAEFSPGQRVTAQQLNSLQSSANEGNYSSNQIVNGKIINNPIKAEYVQQYQAPRFLDTRYMAAQWKFPGEDENVKQHLYVCLVNDKLISLRQNGTYFSLESSHARFAVMYCGKNSHPLRVVTAQDFDLNTDVNTRQMNQHLPDYVSLTNHSGFVETPIPPFSNVHMAQLSLLDSTKRKVGILFLLHANEDGSAKIPQEAKQELLTYIQGCSEWTDVQDAYVEARFTVIINQDEPSGSSLLTRFQNVVGVQEIEPIQAEPWEVLISQNNIIITPAYQVGCQQLMCTAYEDEDFQLHQLSGDERLSARPGQNYVVIDIPRLSAYHTWQSEDHILSDSTNYTAAFHIALNVFDYVVTEPLSGDSLSDAYIQYVNRYPLAPCWETYPF